MNDHVYECYARKNHTNVFEAKAAFARCADALTSVLVTDGHAYVVPDLGSFGIAYSAGEPHGAHFMPSKTFQQAVASSRRFSERTFEPSTPRLTQEDMEPVRGYRDINEAARLLVDFLGEKWEVFTGSGRPPEVVAKRAIGYHLLRDYTGPEQHSYPDMARAFNKTSHSSVISLCQKTKWITEQPEWEHLCQAWQDYLDGGPRSPMAGELAKLLVAAR